LPVSLFGGLLELDELVSLLLDGVLLVLLDGALLDGELPVKPWVVVPPLGALDFIALFEALPVP